MPSEVQCSNSDKLAATPAFMRPVYTVIGLALVGLGFLGFVLPVMPGTIFLILALGAFRRSHPGLEAWLLANRWVGPTLRDWDRDGSIKPRTKVVIYAFLWLSIIGSISSAFRNIHDQRTDLMLTALLLFIASGVTYYIATRPNRIN